MSRPRCRACRSAPAGCRGRGAGASTSCSSRWRAGIVATGDGRRARGTGSAGAASTRSPGWPRSTVEEIFESGPDEGETYPVRRRPDRPRATASATPCCSPSAGPALPPGLRRAVPDVRGRSQRRSLPVPAGRRRSPLGGVRRAAAGAATRPAALMVRIARGESSPTMAVPKKKTSKAKSRSRRASTWTLEAPARSICPQLRRRPSCPTSCARTAAGTTAARPSTSS